jgi:hypothetical protein
MNEQLRCWVCTDHDGMYLGGHSIVFAYNEREAQVLLNKALLDANLHPLEPKYTLREIPIQEGAHVIWNGDY